MSNCGVFSIQCATIILGDTYVTAPKGDMDNPAPLRIDFNITAHTITILCNKDSLRTFPASTDSQPNEFEIITINMKDIKDVTMYRIRIPNFPRSVGKGLVFNLNSPPKTLHTSSLVAAKANVLKLKILNCPELTVLEEKILPNLFGNKFKNGRRERLKESSDSSKFRFNLSTTMTEVSKGEYFQDSSTTTLFLTVAKPVMDTEALNREAEKYNIVLTKPATVDRIITRTEKTHQILIGDKPDDNTSQSTAFTNSSLEQNVNKMEKIVFGMHMQENQKQKGEESLKEDNTMDSLESINNSQGSEYTDSLPDQCVNNSLEITIGTQMQESQEQKKEEPSKKKKAAINTKTLLKKQKPKNNLKTASKENSIETLSILETQKKAILDLDSDQNEVIDLISPDCSFNEMEPKTSSNPIEINTLEMEIISLNSSSSEEAETDDEIKKRNAKNSLKKLKRTKRKCTTNKNDRYPKRTLIRKSNDSTSYTEEEQEIDTPKEPIEISLNSEKELSTTTNKNLKNNNELISVQDSTDAKPAEQKEINFEPQKDVTVSNTPQIVEMQEENIKETNSDLIKDFVENTEVHIDIFDVQHQQETKNDISKTNDSRERIEYLGKDKNKKKRKSTTKKLFNDKEETVYSFSNEQTKKHSPETSRSRRLYDRKDEKQMNDLNEEPSIVQPTKRTLKRLLYSDDDKSDTNNDNDNVTHPSQDKVDAKFNRSNSSSDCIKDNLQASTKKNIVILENIVICQGNELGTKDSSPQELKQQPIETNDAHFETEKGILSPIKIIKRSKVNRNSSSSLKSNDPPNVASVQSKTKRSKTGRESTQTVLDEDSNLPGEQEAISKSYDPSKDHKFQQFLESIEKTLNSPTLFQFHKIKPGLKSRKIKTPIKERKTPIKERKTAARKSNQRQSMKESFGALKRPTSRPKRNTKTSTINQMGGKRNRSSHELNSMKNQTRLFIKAMHHHTKVYKYLVGMLPPINDRIRHRRPFKYIKELHMFLQNYLHNVPEE